jgi:two-component system sensor histidine kinase AlgZ
METLRYVGRMAAVNLFTAAIIVFAFGGVGLHTPWSRIAESVGVALVFCLCIGPLCAIVLPRVSAMCSRRFTFPWNWVVLAGVLMCLAAGGSLFALGLLAAVGYIQPGEVFGAWFASSLRVSIFITLTIGLAVTAYEMMRARLDEATLALRTRERDEAEAHRLATEAQLAVLESRVQPHFLFNTLNSIAALVHQDPAGAERMTGQLASLLRSSLDHESSRLVPLHEEIRVVRDYLDIERVRFGDRLRYDIAVAPDAAQVHVPRLSVQTIVENSVKYAVSPRREGASIAIAACTSDVRTQISVKDDGPGFEAGALPSGHGLSMLQSRLAMLFGERASLRIDGRPGKTVVTMEIQRQDGWDGQEGQDRQEGREG